MAAPARYTIVKKIADGGTAEIFLATQRGAQGFEKLVVLKRIFPAFYADPQFRNMLIDEALIAMSLSHSNIVQVLDLGEADGQYVMALELVDGWSLDAVLRRANAANLPIPPALALYLTAEICRALAYAHAKTGPGGKALGIVHRDISPHNVLLSEQGEVKLTDFGIAKAQNRREQSLGNTIKGKIAYMSPEQASGAQLDPRSDLFSVGTMLYMMICRRYPFDAPTDLEMLLLVKNGDFVPPETARPGLNPEVYRVLRRAMSKRLEDRYQKAEDMLVDVEQVMRLAFRAVGQTELKRWLLELTTRDGVPPLSRATPGNPSTVPGREGETLELKGVAAGSPSDARAPKRPSLGLRPPPPPAALFVSKKNHGAGQSLPAPGAPSHAVPHPAPRPVPGAPGGPDTSGALAELSLTPLPLTPPPEVAEALLAVADAPTERVAGGHEPPAEVSRRVATAEYATDVSLRAPTLLGRLREAPLRRKVLGIGLALAALLLVAVSIRALAGRKRGPDASPSAVGPPASPGAVAGNTADTSTAHGGVTAPASPAPAPAAAAAISDAGAAVAPEADEGAPAGEPPAAAAAPAAVTAAAEAAAEPTTAGDTAADDDSDAPTIDVLLRTVPEGAEVGTTDRPFGTTPVSVKLHPGKRYALIFKHDGYATTTKRIDVTEDAQQEYTITLRRPSAATAKPAAPKPAPPAKPAAPAIPKSTAAKPTTAKPTSPPTPPPSDKPADRKWWQLKIAR
jgi:serine/threonine protein kinase